MFIFEMHIFISLLPFENLHSHLKLELVDEGLQNLKIPLNLQCQRAVFLQSS